MKHVRWEKISNLYVIIILENVLHTSIVQDW